ncbi:DUF6058 family natural product biosynthesis protein, partial [Kibdelosporangium lantanae]
DDGLRLVVQVFRRGARGEGVQVLLAGEDRRAGVVLLVVLSGQYVCLRSVTPTTMRRKDALMTAIDDAVRDPRPDDRSWLSRLHALVDELDALEPPFTAYDRLRFGGPVSRDTHVDQVRAAYSP